MDVHWVDSPEDQSETTNGSKEGSSLGILLFGGCATVKSELVDDDQVSKAGHCIPAPFRRLVDGEGGKKAGKDHDDVSNHGNQDASTVQASEEGQIEQEERGSDTPVDITCPVNLAVDSIVGIRKVLLGVLNQDLVLSDTVTNCHGVVGERSKGSDEGSQDVE